MLSVIQTMRYVLSSLYNYIGFLDLTYVNYYFDDSLFFYLHPYSPLSSSDLSSIYSIFIPFENCIVPPKYNLEHILYYNSIREDKESLLTLICSLVGDLNFLISCSTTTSYQLSFLYFTLKLATKSAIVECLVNSIYSVRKQPMYSNFGSLVTEKINPYYMPHVSKADIYDVIEHGIETSSLLTGGYTLIPKPLFNLVPASDVINTSAIEFFSNVSSLVLF